MISERFIKSIVAVSANDEVRLPWATTAARSMRAAKLERDLDRSIASLTQELGMLINHSYELSLHPKVGVFAD